MALVFITINILVVEYTQYILTKIPRFPGGMHMADKAHRSILLAVQAY